LPWEAIRPGAFVWEIYEKKYVIRSPTGKNVVLCVGNQDTAERWGDRWIPAPEDWRFEVREVDGTMVFVPVGQDRRKPIKVSMCDSGHIYQRHDGGWCVCTTCTDDDHVEFFLLASETYVVMENNEILYEPTSVVKIEYHPPTQE
jgi:hypothetical protein